MILLLYFGCKDTTKSEKWKVNSEKLFARSEI